jgi:hypothetical protein
VLYRLLTEDQLDTLEKTCLPVPDTNWKDDDKKTGQILSVYFAFAQNPVTDRIEFFQVDENKRNLYALNQKDWVDGPWSIYAMDLTKQAQKQSLAKLTA